MSFTMGITMFVDVRSLIRTFTKMGLNVPAYVEVDGTGHYEASTEVVRTWFKREYKINKMLSNGGSVGPTQVEFLMIMRVIGDNAVKYSMDHEDDNLDMTDGVVDGYKAMFF